MEKQFILVAEVKEMARPVNLASMQEKFDFPVTMQWMFVCGNRQVYHMIISPGKIAALKSMLDGTGLYDKLELFEFVSF